VRSLKDALAAAVRRRRESDRAFEAQLRAADQARLQELGALSDEELIAQAPARTSLSKPRHEMEMQRRLKVATENLTAETQKARIWAAWSSAVIAILTVVLVVLTVVLATKN
jgi:hypothetical protein